jgi:predicted DNA-binding ribbon-helix-helix protein
LNFVDLFQERGYSVPMKITATPTANVDFSKVTATDSSSRGLRLHNSLWEVVEAAADARGISPSKLIREAVVASLVQAQ